MRYLLALLLLAAPVFADDICVDWDQPPFDGEKTWWIGWSPGSCVENPQVNFAPSGKTDSLDQQACIGFDACERWAFRVYSCSVSTGLCSEWSASCYEGTPSPDGLTGTPECVPDAEQPVPPVNLRRATVAQ